MSEAPDAAAPAAPRCGFIALIGAPNVGKSSLVNTLTGAKVSIVSRKVQTTRTTLRGIALHGASQLVFVDTPGIFAPRRRLDRAMVQRAWAGAADADLIALIVDAATGLDDETAAILPRLSDMADKAILVLNKIDLVKPEGLLALAGALNEKLCFRRTFMVSAKTGDGVGDLRDYLAEQVPAGPWLYPEDQLTDAPLRHLAAEITREKLFDRLHDEVPYASTVETTDWKTVKGGAARIEQTIYVERESQRKIVLGKGGRAIRDIGTAARLELAKILETPVHLFLFVKVRERWGEDRARYREMGLDFPDE
ncbi:MAG: GTPase Era [Hyphomicrobiales bacterium]|nr:GTPase Era [Hyphomicrobiales bacterium]